MGITVKTPDGDRVISTSSVGDDGPLAQIFTTSTVNMTYITVLTANGPVKLAVQQQADGSYAQVIVLQGGGGSSTSTVTKNVSTTWFTDQKTPIASPKTRATSWGVRTQIVKTLSSSWGVRSRVAKTGPSTLWGVKAKITKTGPAVTWKVRSRVAKTGPTTTWTIATNAVASYNLSAVQSGVFSGDLYAIDDGFTTAFGDNQKMTTNLLVNASDSHISFHLSEYSSPWTLDFLAPDGVTVRLRVTAEPDPGGFGNVIKCYINGVSQGNEHWDPNSGPAALDFVITSSQYISLNGNFNGAGGGTINSWYLNSPASGLDAVYVRFTLNNNQNVTGINNSTVY